MDDGGSSRLADDHLPEAASLDVNIDDYSKESSWVELAATDSECGSSTFTMLTDAHLRSAASSYRGSQRQSPKSVHSTNATVSVDLNANLEKVKFELVRELASERLKTAWVRDWSSRPEAVPPFGYPWVLKAQTAFTPPNSPYNSCRTIDNVETVRRHFSLRHSRLISYDWFSVEVISTFVCGQLVSFIIGLYVGIYFCRKRFPGVIGKHLL